MTIVVAWDVKPQNEQTINIGVGVVDQCEVAG